MNTIPISSDKEYQGLADKIGLIRRYYEGSMRYPSVRAYAEKASMGPETLPSVETLFATLRAVTRYVPDPVGVELIKAPWVQVDEIRTRGYTAGDCDDFASLSYTLLRNVGVAAELAVAWYGDNPNPTHIFVVIPTKGGGRIPFDLVAPQLGVTKPGISMAAAYE